MENWSKEKNIGKQECSAENEGQQELWQGVCRRVTIVSVDINISIYW